MMTLAVALVTGLCLKVEQHLGNFNGAEWLNFSIVFSLICMIALHSSRSIQDPCFSSFCQEAVKVRTGAAVCATLVVENEIGKPVQFNFSTGRSDKKSMWFEHAVSLEWTDPTRTVHGARASEEAVRCERQRTCPTFGEICVSCVDAQVDWTATQASRRDYACEFIRFREHGGGCLAAFKQQHLLHSSCGA